MASGLQENPAPKSCPPQGFGTCSFLAQNTPTPACCMGIHRAHCLKSPLRCGLPSPRISDSVPPSSFSVAQDRVLASQLLPGPEPCVAPCISPRGHFHTPVKGPHPHQQVKPKLLPALTFFLLSVWVTDQKGKQGRLKSSLDLGEQNPGSLLPLLTFLSRGTALGQ